MKILIKQKTIVYHKKDGTFGLLVQDNISSRYGCDFVIDWGDVLQKATFREGIDKQEAFDRMFLIIGEL